MAAALPEPVKAALRRANHEILRLRALANGRGEHDDAIDRALARLEGTIVARKSQGNPYHDAQGHFTNPAGVGHAAPGSKGKGKAGGRRARLRRLKARFRRHRDRLKARHRSERRAMRDRHRSERKAASPAHRESTAAYHREERERLAASHRGERAGLRARVRERAEAIKSSGPGAKARAPRDLADADPRAVEAAWDELGDHWRQSLSPKERTAVEQYTGRYFEGVNNLARKGKVGKVSDPDNAVDDATARRVLADTDAALAKARLPGAAVVYRGVSDLGKLGLRPGALVGATARDQGFLSTSLTPKVAEGFARGRSAAILRISAPEGSPGIAMAGVSSVPREREVLFARGATLKVTRASRDASGRHVLDAELSYEAAAGAARSIERSIGDGEGEGDGGGTGVAPSREEIKFGWGEGDVEVEPGEGGGDVEVDRSVSRAAHGNPNHKGKGPGGGQFTSGPGGGGGGADQPHGKHWAKRQRRKRRKGRATRKPGQAAKKAKAKPASKPGSSGSGRRHTPNQKEALDRLRKGKPAEYASEKARRAAESQNKTDGKVQAYTKANEHELARKLGGKSYPDNEPADVDLKLKDGSTRGLELKTVTHGTNDKVTMKKDALARKVGHQEETGRTMYTVIEDHRDTYDGGANKGLYSGHKLYMQVGTGSYRIKSCVPLKDYAQLKEYANKTPDELRAINPKFKGKLRGTNR